ncbi:cell division protein FtsA [Candidatus Uhrbacteria bacterium]|nr:cell division protein FtsA [Candidatus Uhrbacteria bacterium]
MGTPRYYAGIDIGSTAVRVAVGQKLPVGEKEQIHIIGAAEVPSEGINRGVINSIEDAVSSVSTCIEKVERMTGVPLQAAWVSISGSNVMPMESKGVVAVSRADGEIREDDVERAIEAAQTVAAPVNFEILHVIPKTFTVDGQKGIKDPAGMNGIRLEVDAQIIHGSSAHIKNLTKCVYRTGVNIEHVVLGILATAEVAATAKQRELGVAVVNLGGSTTSIAVFEQGEMLLTSCLPIGSDHVTADVAIGLRTSIEIAEKVKLSFASALPREMTKKDEINLRELGADEDEVISLKYVAQIVEARIDEIFEKIDKELKRIGRSGMLPAGVILTGGGAKLPGIVEFAKEKLRLPVSQGYPVGVTSITDRVNDMAFTGAIGLVQWGANGDPAAESRGGFMAAVKPVAAVAGQLKKWWQAVRP